MDITSGFKEGDSTILRLLTLLHNIYQGLDQNKEIILIFLDISKAFDRVWHPGLLFKLKQMGIVDPLYSWFVRYLRDRSQRVVIGGKVPDMQNYRVKSLKALF